MKDEAARGGYIFFFSVTPPRHTASDFNPFGAITFGREAMQKI